MRDFHSQFQQLELPVLATREQVKQAQRELLQIWHPDRFTHSPTVQNRAEQTCKAINEAAQTLLNCAKEAMILNIGYALSRLLFLRGVLLRTLFSR